MGLAVPARVVLAQGRVQTGIKARLLVRVGVRVSVRVSVSVMVMVSVRVQTGIKTRLLQYARFDHSAKHLNIRSKWHKYVFIPTPNKHATLTLTVLIPAPINTP